MSFEPISPGQFVSRGPGWSLFLAPGQVALRFEAATLRMKLRGASAGTASAHARQTGVVNYFLGNDPKKWRTGIPTYGKVRYAQVYPGVDLVFYGNQRQLEYDFVVAPGADPGRIGWQIEGARPGIDPEGNLILGSAVFNKPVLYQTERDRRIPVEGSFEVAGNLVRFRVGRYDPSRELIIDPVLSYASYLGGSGTERIGTPTGPGNLTVGAAGALAVDNAGSVYVTGRTFSLDFPTRNPLEGAPPQKQSGVQPGFWPSIFVTKFSPDGGSLVYSTYLGGDSSDQAFAIAVDSGGNAYVTGETNSNNFPVTAGAYQTTCSPAPTNSATPSASCNSSNASTFITKLNSTGTALVYSTFLGGYGLSYGTAIAVDSAGRAYVAGNQHGTCDTNHSFQGCFPTTGKTVIAGNQPHGGAAPQYTFAAVFNPSGSQLLYSTLFGETDYKCDRGCADTWGTAIAVDTSGYFYVVGESQSDMLPTTSGVVQPTSAPLDGTNSYLLGWRGFVAKFKPVTTGGGAALSYATYLGGKTGGVGDYLSGVNADAAGNAYVAGYTNSKDFPVTAGAYGTACGTGGSNCSAAHLTKLNPAGSHILWSTYVGGSRTDGTDAVFYTGPVQLDGSGNVYIIGQTSGGKGFPMVNPVEPMPSGGSQQVLVAELDPSGENLLFSSILGTNGLNTASPAGMAVDSAGNIYVAGNTDGPNLITTPNAFQTSSSDGACCQRGNGFVVKIASDSLRAVNAFSRTATGFAPGELISILAPAGGSHPIGPAQGILAIPGQSFPTALGGVQVTFSPGGIHAPVLYASASDVIAVVPYEMAGVAAPTLQIAYAGKTTDPLGLPPAATAPGIQTLNQQGSGAAVALNSDGHGGWTYNSEANPASRSGHILFFVTGAGLVNPAVTGRVNSSLSALPVPLAKVEVNIDGLAAGFTSSEMAGIVSGILAIDAQIPAGVHAGEIPVLVKVGGVASQSGVTVSVK